MKFKISIQDNERVITFFPEKDYDKKVLELINDAPRAVISSSKRMEYGYSQYKEIQSLSLTLDYSTEVDGNANITSPFSSDN